MMRKRRKNGEGTFYKEKESGRNEQNAKVKEVYNNWQNKRRNISKIMKDIF